MKPRTGGSSETSEKDSRVDVMRIQIDGGTSVLARHSTSTLKPTGGDARPSIEYIESISP